MKSIKNLGQVPAGISLAADEIIEFHATRLLLLISTCGKRNRSSKLHSIEGLTKLAKLDFFVRYPAFFNKVAAYLKRSERIESNNGIESKMIRFRYGPWDKRYYQVLPFLEARGLLEISKRGTQYVFSLTALGEEVVGQIEDKPEFQDTVNKMMVVGTALKSLNGNKLKTIIYDLFKSEVSERHFNDLIDTVP